MNPTELNCIFCSKNFPNVSSMSLHYYTDHSAYYHCEWCYAQFHSANDAKKHSEVVHIGKAAFNCLWCDFHSRSKKDLAGHRRELHVRELREISCRTCQTVYKNQEILSNHMFYIHNARHLKVEPPSPPNRHYHQVPNVEPISARAQHHEPPNVGRVLPNHQTANAQSVSPRIQYQQAPNVPPVQLKTNESHGFDKSLKKFHCKYCSKKFDDRVQHCLHLIKDHNTYFMCSYCDMHAESLKRLDEHYKIVHLNYKSWTCIYCWVEFNDLSLLKAHQTMAKHDVIMCPFCTKLMPSQECLMVHKEFESNPMKFEDRTPTSVDDVDSYLCLVCFKRVASGKYEKHSRDHINKDGLPPSCNECFSFILWPKHLHNHLDCFKHEASRIGPDIHSCDVCGYKSLTKAQASRHFGWCHKVMQCKLCPEEYKGFRGEKIHAVGHGVPLRKIYDSILKPNEEQSQPLPGVPVTLTAKQIMKKQAKGEKKNAKVIERNSVQAKKISPLIVQSTPKVKKEKPSDDDGNSTKKRKRKKSESINTDDDDAESSSASITEVKTNFEKRMKKFQEQLMLLSSDDESADSSVVQQKKKRKSSSSSSSSEDLVRLPELNKEFKKGQENKKLKNPSMSSKVIELDAALFGSTTAPVSAPAPAPNPPIAGKPSTVSKGKELSQVEFVCTLCGSTSLYKQSIKRHVVFVHRVSEDQYLEFCQERVKIPPPICIRVETKLAENTDRKNVHVQTDHVVCGECKEMKIKYKKLKTLFKRFMNAATEMKTVLGEND